MGVDNGSVETFGVEQDHALSAPANPASAGSGGDDLSIYSANRETQLRALVAASFTNASEYTLSKGLVDSFGSFSAFDTNEIGFSAPGTSAENGASTQMAIFAKDRITVLNRLVTATFTNSASAMPKGIVDSFGSFSAFETQEMGLAEPDGSAEYGSGGDDMGVWTASEQERRRSLVTATLTNASAYTVPKGIVDTFGTFSPFDANEPSLVDPPKGVRLGPNYYNLLIEGHIKALPSNSQEDPIKVTDAEITAMQDGRSTTFTTAPRDDGTFALSVDQFGTWTVTAQRQHLKPATQEIEVANETEPGNDLTLIIPSGGKGLQIAEGIRLG